MSPPTPASGERLRPPPGGVVVRMYRQGLGDCFLLAFDRGPAEPFYALIDCGVIVGTEKATEMMTAVARSIAAATDDHLDLLVATHEHWDHISGFSQAEAVFGEVAVDEIWLAWTEDPKDRLAKELRNKRAMAVRALRGAVARLQGLDADAAGRARGVLDFFGDATLGATTTDALAALRRLGDVRYRRPGEGPLALNGVGGARVYILGPPLDVKLLKRANPSKRESEVYEEPGFALDLESAFYAATTLGADEPRVLPLDEAEVLRLSFPFDESHRTATAQARAAPFFRERYFGPWPTAADESWRGIDGDWLAATGELALKLDNATNNTSLALAIELLPSRQVLLFPADAQVGNWLSWDQLSWPNEGDGAPIQAADLLRRTVLYKVGHHASHNATMREQGLERMQSPELVAMIPVDEKMAREKKHWNMPFPPLLERLEEKTRGRILRADQGLPTKPSGVSAATWKRFRDRAAATDLYVELRIDG